MTRPDDIPEKLWVELLALPIISENFDDGDFETIARFILSAQAEATEAAWQPIETAPKDNLLLLSCVGWLPAELKNAPWPVKVGGWWGQSWHVFGASWNPTHWKPLPTAPTSTQE